jgi:hypothetical protein
MTANRNGCPACLAPEAVDLETIGVAEQHRLYAPKDSSLERKLTEQASRSSVEYTMRRCSDCALEYCDPLIAPNSAWYDLAYRALELYPAERWEFDYVLNQLRPADSLFEMGCGDGSFLKRCREKGLIACGADFSAAAVKKCGEAGLDVSLLEIGGTAAPKRSEAATQITAFHVLEHLDHPETLFQTAALLAGETAALWVAVPSDLRASRLLEERDFLDQPPHHMTRWTDEALEAVGARCGWTLQTIIREPIPTGTAVW